MLPVYDKRVVPSHGDSTGPRVMLINEAPGPNEAESGIPAFGLQGANIFHALRASGISWAARHPTFVWPQDGSDSQSSRHGKKAAFMCDRRKNISCTNSFAQWPKPSANSTKFCAPSAGDVLSHANLARLQSEVIASHRVILVCGLSAYLACTGEPLGDSSSRERTLLDSKELAILNTRLRCNFESGWYMGHTRRWSLQRAATAETLRSVGRSVGWLFHASAG